MQSSFTDISKDSCQLDYVLYETPVSTRFPFHVQKQSKAIKKTTLNWDKGPYLVYLHAVDIINQLHVHLALLFKNRNNTLSKKKEENNFTQRTKSLSGSNQVLSG